MNEENIVRLITSENTEDVLIALALLENHPDITGFFDKHANDKRQHSAKSKVYHKFFRFEKRDYINDWSFLIGKETIYEFNITAALNISSRTLEEIQKDFHENKLIFL